MIENNFEETLSDESELIKNFSVLFQNEFLSDVRLKVGNTKFVAHKLVLSASSDVMSKIFDDNWSKSTHVNGKDGDFIVLEENPECEKFFLQFLKCFYTGKVIFTTENVTVLLCLANKYNFELLRNLAKNYIGKNSVSPHLANSVKWHSWMKLLNYDDIANMCLRTIDFNFKIFISRPELWTSLDISFVCGILESSSIVVDDEYSIYNLCTLWLQNEDKMENFESNALKLFPLIRFAMMTPAQLCKIKDEFTEYPRLTHELGTLIAKAHEYRSMCLFTDTNKTFVSEWYRPRNYLNLKVHKINSAQGHKLNSINVQAIKTPYISKELANWDIRPGLSKDKLIVKFSTYDASYDDLELKTKCILIAVNEDEQVINVAESVPFISHEVNEQSLDIDLNGNNSKNISVFILIKVFC